MIRPLRTVANASLALATVAVQAQTVGGLWYDPARPAQGLMFEELNGLVADTWHTDQRVAVSWYTWAPQNDSARGPRWLYGIGSAEDMRVTVDLLEIRGGRFGVLLDPGEIEHVPWGRVEIDFNRRPAIAHYHGPAGWGSGEMELTQLTRMALGTTNDIALDPAIPADFQRAGTYYDPTRPAGGWILNQQESEDAGRSESLLLWFSWDANGRPLWMFGIDDDDADGLDFEMQWAAGGGRFEPGYTLDQVNLLPWGRVWLEGESCVDEQVTAVNWQARTHGFGDGRARVVRATHPTFNNVVLNCADAP